MATPACVPDRSFLLVPIASNSFFACQASSSAPSGPDSKTYHTTIHSLIAARRARGAAVILRKWHSCASPGGRTGICGVLPVTEHTFCTHCRHILVPALCTKKSLLGRKTKIHVKYWHVFGDLYFETILPSPTRDSVDVLSDRNVSKNRASLESQPRT